MKLLRIDLGLGSNLGDRREKRCSVEEALRELVDLPDCHLLAVSRAYASRPSGLPDGDFINAAASFAWGGGSLVEFLHACQALERKRGRVAPGAPGRSGNRPIDLDLLAAWPESDGRGSWLTRADPQLTLPHPRAFERDFVLRPWLDLPLPPQLSERVRRALTSLPGPSRCLYEGPSLPLRLHAAPA